MTIIQAHHRNGVSGQPFDVFLEDGKVIVTFAGTDPEAYAGCTAVLDVALLAAGEIGFGRNSWRGDQWEADLIRRRLIPTGHCPGMFSPCGNPVFGDDGYCADHLPEPKP